MYETVIGLETHVELATQTKVFCSCTTQFGGEPNTHCCPVCTGQPGSLPALNRRAVELTVTAGLALNCGVNRESAMDRKHYVYPDLPKAYQISQSTVPLCSEGHVQLSDGRVIGIDHIHLEEDAGKLVHRGGSVFVDYNRGGVPLIEIVTMPDFRSADEAVEYLEHLQVTLRAAGVSDCRMQEGSLRCDVNISLRQRPEDPYGVKVEIKNLNSFASVAAAIAYEYERQSEILDDGGTVKQETRGFDVAQGITLGQRGKENADDYRYFPEPDILPIFIGEEILAAIKAHMPVLPAQRQENYIAMGVSPADAALIAKYRPVCDYFEAAIAGTDCAKTAASLIVTEVFARVTSEAQRECFAPAVKPEWFRELLQLLQAGKLNAGRTKKVFAQMLDGGCDLHAFLAEGDLAGMDSAELESICKRVLAANPAAAEDYRAGKEKAFNVLIGAVMKESRGKADAALTRRLLAELLQA